ncbi:alpha/beta hydrolase [Coralloluteibacterium stylophorae]|uniref:Alpha/beta hydrolase n=1 Tax=Coralloluteibacterium stylophorae TaxID=1776034 RepID=A0A8J8AWA8_9GAMM|nr:alpha/beta hydrolase-fold protein [Coralloluteibacterium stylophorae]MBS7458105.1 alpha/beta hydrolase [Coralloluteibacterium stylophorae]
MLRRAARFLPIALALAASTATAQPRLDQPAAPSIADRAVAGYRYERFELASLDGARHYRVQVAIPDRPAPAAGFRSVWLLDGNAAFPAIADADVQRLLASGDAPVIVAIGPATGLRLDVEARAFDYTPAAPGGGPEPDPDRPGRTVGGAEVFFALLEDAIRPRVEALAALDPGRRTLWGHSYGGLFVLHTLMAHPHAFSHWVAASPSLWWQDGRILAAAARWAGPASPAAEHVLVLHGGDEHADAQRRAGIRAAADPRAAERARRLAAAPADAGPALVERLDALARVDATYRTLPGLTHGQTLDASVPVALGF